jgi:hypothetical protein
LIVGLLRFLEDREDELLIDDMVKPPPPPKAESLACGYFFHSKVRDNTALLRAEKSTRARTDKINTTL